MGERKGSVILTPLLSHILNRIDFTFTLFESYISVFSVFNTYLQAKVQSDSFAPPGDMADQIIV